MSSILIKPNKKMGRSIWKAPYCNWVLKDKLNLRKNYKKKIWARNSIILPQFLGKKVQIHNGKFFISLNVLAKNIGFKFGKFSASKFSNRFNKKKKLGK